MFKQKSIILYIFLASSFITILHASDNQLLKDAMLLKIIDNKYKLYGHKEYNNENGAFRVFATDMAGKKIAKASVAMYKKSYWFFGRQETLTCSVRGIFVNKEMQHQGIGKALMHTISNYAKSQDCTSITLTPFQSAIGFYKKLGFSGDPCLMRKKL